MAVRVAASPFGFLHHHLGLPRLRPFSEPPRRRIALRHRSTGPCPSARLRCLAESKPGEPTPVESPPEALGNGKPTVVEFYADWCEVCREI